jgi:hypothetical protein
MRRSARLTLVALPIATTLGCGGSKVMVPPRIDLQQHEILAIIEFSSNAKGELGPLATARFMEEARLDQGLVRIVDLGSEDEALREVDERSLGRSAFQELGAAHEVATIFTGELVVSDIRPTVSISSDLSKLGAAADVDATLTVQMVETASGASIWSRSASVTQRVGQVSVFGGRDIVFDADDPERAYGDLVNALVQLVTADFKVSWVRS